MSDSKINVFRQILQEAEQHGIVFANSIKTSFPDDGMELGVFVDALFSFYYLMDSRQFLVLLNILYEVFDLPSVESVALSRTDIDKADAYIPFFLEAVVYAILEMDSEGL